MTPRRPSRSVNLALHYASEALRHAIVTGPFVWLPGIAIAMEVSERYGWVSSDTAYDVTFWAAMTCLVLWLPASPLVRLVLALVVGGLWDICTSVRNLLRRKR